MRVLKIIILTSIVAFLVYYRIETLDKKAKDGNFEKQLGIYKIDLIRTNFVDYLKDSVLYKDLTITFNNDSSFYLNKNVPFIIEQSGTWTTSGEGIEIWNTMFFGENKGIHYSIFKSLD